MPNTTEGLWSVTRSVAAQKPGVPFWDLVRLSIYLSTKPLLEPLFDV